MSATKTPATDSLELARVAINYVLKRIRDDANLRYHMGAFTESFDRLANAHSALNGISKKAIEKDILLPRLTQKANGQLIEEIKDAIDGSQFDEPAMVLRRITTILGR